MPAGRPRVFGHQEELWEAFEIYALSVKDDEPLTLVGFRKFCDNQHGSIKQYFDNKRGCYNEYIFVCSKIKDSMFERNLSLYKKGIIGHSIVLRQSLERGLPLNRVNGRYSNKEFMSDTTYKDSINRQCRFKGNKKKTQMKHLHENKTGYIYFIKLKDTEYYKIGYSGNPQRRIYDIASSNPHEIIVLEIKSSLFAYELEQELHVIMREKSVRGEWYKFDELDVKMIYKFLNSI